MISCILFAFWIVQKWKHNSETLKWWIQNIFFQVNCDPFGDVSDDVTTLIDIRQKKFACRGEDDLNLQVKTVFDKVLTM